MGTVLRRVALVGGAALALGCSLAACRSAVEPLPPDATPLTPPAVYARWWAMTEACSGRAGDLSAVRWYEVPGAALILRGETVNGYWSPAENAIVIPHDYARTGFAVRHEMLHALLRRGGHPRDQFLGACAALVDCAESCARDAGPWSPPAEYASYATAPPDSVELTSDVRAEPPEADGERWVTLRVLVRNPAPRAVLVRPSDIWPRPAFAYDLRGPKGGLAEIEAAADSSRFFFAPFETKAFLYEFVGDGGLPRVALPPDGPDAVLPPGEYVMRGGYAGRWAEYVSVTVER